MIEFNNTKNEWWVYSYQSSKENLTINQKYCKKTKQYKPKGK